MLVCRSLKSPDGKDMYYSETRDFELEEIQGGNVCHMYRKTVYEYLHGQRVGL